MRKHETDSTYSIHFYLELVSFLDLFLRPHAAIMHILLLFYDNKCVINTTLCRNALPHISSAFRILSFHILRIVSDSTEYEFTIDHIVNNNT